MRFLASVGNLKDSTTEDSATGAVRSVQTADLLLTEQTLASIWSPMHLERLARTYWRFLTRVTLGLVRVHYTATERLVVLIARPLTLFAFTAPEYEIDPDRGLVRWRIESGLLVAKRGHGRNTSGPQGHLQIHVTRSAASQPGEALLHIEIEVANFHPAIASGLGSWIYSVTQSKVHVLVTHAFLRSLSRLQLAESRVGRLIPRQPSKRAPDAPNYPATDAPNEPRETDP